MPLKNPVTPPGIDPETVRVVAQWLNHYATPSPALCSAGKINCLYKLWTTQTIHPARSISPSEPAACLFATNRSPITLTIYYNSTHWHNSTLTVEINDQFGNIYVNGTAWCRLVTHESCCLLSYPPIIASPTLTHKRVTPITSPRTLWSLTQTLWCEVMQYQMNKYKLNSKIQLIIQIVTQTGVQKLCSGMNRGKGAR